MPLRPCSSHDELRSLAGARIAGGRLPVMVPTEVSAGYGSGEPCGLCGQPIDPQQVDYEVVDQSLDRSWEFHLACYSVWQLECVSRLDHQRPML